MNFFTICLVQKFKGMPYSLNLFAYNPKAISRRREQTTFKKVLRACFKPSILCSLFMSFKPKSITVCFSYFSQQSKNDVYVMEKFAAMEI